MNIKEIWQKRKKKEKEKEKKKGITADRPSEAREETKAAGGGGARRAPEPPKVAQMTNSIDDELHRWRIASITLQ